MKYSRANLGRIFILRLEEGEILHKEIERFAKIKKLKSAVVVLLGAADKDSKIVVGPRNVRSRKIFPMEVILGNVYETVGVGTIFPNSKDEAVLHMHSIFGRGKEVRCGCVRLGVKIWYVAEAIIFELKNSSARRIKDKKTGFELLEP